MVKKKKKARLGEGREYYFPGTWVFNNKSQDIQRTWKYSPLKGTKITGRKHFEKARHCI
jgi:hypothetical protein